MMQLITHIQELAQLIDGLLVPSETDAAFEIFLWPAHLPWQPALIVQGLQLPADTPINQLALAAFFAPLTRMRQSDTPAMREQRQRFVALQTWLEANLAEIAMYRIGTIEIAVWIIGRTAEGRLIGLTTMQVET
jgi:Nuclease A inhibitor-like protein